MRRLKEWLDAKGNKVSLNTSTSSSPAQANNTFDNTYRYKRLLAQIDADGICTYTINLLDDRILAITLNNGVGVKIIFKPYVPCYLVQVDGRDTTCDDYEDVLKLLIIEGIIGDTDLCEAMSSIDFHEEFKEYEEMWDTLDEWLDSKGNRVSINSSSTSSSTPTTSNNKPVTVYTYSLWTGSPPNERGKWVGAKFINGVLEGEVFSTPEKAKERGEDLLTGVRDPEKFTIDILSFSAVLTNKAILDVTL